MTKQRDYPNSKKARAHSLSRWPVIITNLLIFTALIFFSLQANAENKATPTQVAQYNVYAGGIHALEVNLINDLSDKNKYEVDMQAQTYGLLGKLAPWSGTFNSFGWKGDTYKPEQHESTAIWRGEEETKTYRYKKDGTFESYKRIEDGEDKTPEEIDSELTENSTDILTAALNVMRNISAGESCGSETEIFDGKRRYKLVFQKKQDVVLESSRYNVYEGPAIQCTAIVEPLAGKWYEKPRGWASIQEQGRKKGSLPTVWFAVLEEGKPAMPVKVRVKTDYGTLFMHLTDYNGSGKNQLAAQ